MTVTGQAYLLLRPGKSEAGPMNKDKDERTKEKTATNTEQTQTKNNFSVDPSDPTESKHTKRNANNVCK